MLRLTALCAFLLVVLAAPAAAAPEPWGLMHLRSKDIPLGQSTRFKDTILRHPSHQAHAAVGSGTDVVLTAPDGTAMTVTISDQYGPSPLARTAAQNAVNFLSTRVHNFELGLLKVFVGPPAEVSSICGAQEALACYAPGENRMYVPGETPPNSPVPVEYIITHEFGHHIANHRKNALGSAFTLGPENWATSQFICAGVLSSRPRSSRATRATTTSRTPARAGRTPTRTCPRTGSNPRRSSSARCFTATTPPLPRSARTCSRRGSEP
jgi:hypothetical protein